MNVFEYKQQLKNFCNLKRFNLEGDELDDFVMDVLMKCHTKLHLFNSEKSDIKTWINNVAKNLYIDKHVRKKKSEAKYLSTLKMQETQETLIDLEAFEDYITLNYPHLLELFNYKKLDMETEDILSALSIEKKELKSLEKELKSTWINFNEN